MTIGRYEDKDGGGNGVKTTADSLVSSNQQVDVGKKTKTDNARPRFHTGVPMVDEGLACEGAELDGVDCFLPPERRASLAKEFDRRIARTRNAFLMACSKVEMQVLVEKSEGSGPLVQFLVGVLSGFLLGQLGKAVVSFKAAVKMDPDSWTAVAQAAADKVSAPVRLGPTVNPGPSLRERALIAVEKFDKGRLEAKIDQYVEKGKEAPKKMGEKAHDAEVKTKQQESIEYLDVVQSTGEKKFDTLEQVLPAGTTDAELATLVEMFDIDRDQAIEDFVKAIRKKLERYLNSGIDQIGRHETNRITGQTLKGEITGAVPVNHDVKVRWRHYLSGWPPELEFVHQTADGGHRDPSRGEVKPGVSDSESRYKRLVDPELWSVAVAKHKGLWGKDPEVLDVDDSDSDDAKRSMAAKTQKANIAKMQVAAEHAKNISLKNQQDMEQAKAAAKNLAPKPLIDTSTMLDTD